MSTVNPGTRAGLTYGSSFTPNPDLNDLKTWEIMDKYTGQGIPVSENEGMDFSLTGTEQSVYPSFDRIDSYDRQPSALSQLSLPHTEENPAMDVLPDDLRSEANSKEDIDAEIAKYQAEIDVLNSKILNLEAEIKYQKSLKEAEATRDPLWEQAKYKFIYHNDSSGLENILTRQSNEKIAKASKDQTKADTVDAWQSKINSYDWGIERLIARGKNNPANFTKEDVDNLNEIISNRRFAAAEKARTEGKKFNEAEFEMDLAAKGIDIKKLNSGSLQPWNTETIGDEDYINVDSELTTVLTNIDNVISSNESAKINSKIDNINDTRQLIESNDNISEAEKRAAISKLDEAMAKLERAKQTLEEGDKYTQLKADYDIAVRKGKFSDQKRILDEMDKLEGHVDERKQLRTEYQERVKAWTADKPRRDKQKEADGILAKYRRGDIDQTTAENNLKNLADDTFTVELSGFSENDKNKAKATVKKR